MRCFRPVLDTFLSVCACAGFCAARSTPPWQVPSPPAHASALTVPKSLIDESNEARAAGDFAGARAKASAAVEFLVARERAERDGEWLAVVHDAGAAAYYANDLLTARRAFECEYEFKLAALPDDHPELQSVRQLFGSILHQLGDIAGARALDEKVLEVRSRTLPDDHPELQSARMNMAATLRAHGDLAGAQALYERVFLIRSNTLDDDHPDLQLVRMSLGATVYSFGDFARARVLFEQVVGVYARTLPEDHPDLQSARMNLAVVIKAQGDLQGARVLQERVLAVHSRTLPEDHPDLQRVRTNLGLTLARLGDLAAARTLQERALANLSRTLPEAHPELQAARTNLALTLFELGDVESARVFDERVLAVRSETLPEGHPDLQRARENVAGGLYARGELAAARALYEKVLAVRSPAMPDDHPSRQSTQESVALILHASGDSHGALELHEKVLEVRLRHLPADHPDLQRARLNVALTLVSELARTRSSSGTGNEGRDTLARSAALIGDVCLAHVRSVRAAILAGSAREAEERCASMSRAFDVCASFALGYGEFEPSREVESRAFVFAETMRGAALASADLARLASSSPEYVRLRKEFRSASEELADLAQRGTTSEEFDRARRNREAAERALAARAVELAGTEQQAGEFDVESLSATLAAGEAAIGFRRFNRWRAGAQGQLVGPESEPTVASLCAFVVRSSKDDREQRAGGDSLLTWIDLGPIAPVQAAAHAWRVALGTGSGSRGVSAEADETLESTLRVRGARLREQIFDPLLSALAGVHRVVVALDDVLHLIPLDALPLEQGEHLGDRWRIETRTTLTELLRPTTPFGASPELVAFGDVQYGANATPPDPARPAAGGAPSVPVAAEPHASGSASLLRGGSWERGFSALPATGVEVRGVASRFAERFGGEVAPRLCQRDRATRARLLELAPTARWLHIATHGWFAPESIPSWNADGPVDERARLGTRRTGSEEVRGMSPMLLCGLALAGANSPEDAVGRAPGLLTADELSTLDLSNCELAVLSACDTSIGDVRAGQGVASLQKALHMAGARSAITSLWKVPDEATKDLMLDFYRRLWLERKPKWQALWEAKKFLRVATNERGEAKYKTRDWAAWVLTGDSH